MRNYNPSVEIVSPASWLRCTWGVLLLLPGILMAEEASKPTEFIGTIGSIPIYSLAIDLNDPTNIETRAKLCFRRRVGSQSATISETCRLQIKLTNQGAPRSVVRLDDAGAELHAYTIAAATNGWISWSRSDAPKNRDPVGKAPEPVMCLGQPRRLLGWARTLAIDTPVPFMLIDIFPGTERIRVVEGRVVQREGSRLLAVRNAHGDGFDLPLDDDGVGGFSFIRDGITFAFTRSEKPLPDEPRLVQLSDLIGRAGPAPSAHTVNHYRVPPTILANLPRDAFQQVRDGLLVCTTAAGEVTAPTGEDLAVLTGKAAGEEIPSAISAWAAKIDPPADVPMADRVARLAAEVGRYIRTDAMVVDADALTAFTTRRGDCTERAHLLCAVLRALGIPARVEYGIIWNQEIPGWVGHAWVGAWDEKGKTWIHADPSGTKTPRCCYIRTSQQATTGLSPFIGATIEVVPNE